MLTDQQVFELRTIAINAMDKHGRAALDDWIAKNYVSPLANYPDACHVQRFADAMKAKMATSALKGRSGWNDPMQCTDASLRRLLVKAVRKGDPVDVGNFAMMLFTRGVRTLLPSLTDDIDQQMAVVDAARHQRLERRLQNVPVEVERRQGGDRRRRFEDIKN